MEVIEYEGGTITRTKSCRGGSSAGGKTQHVLNEEANKCLSTGERNSMERKRLRQGGEEDDEEEEDDEDDDEEEEEQRCITCRWRHDYEEGLTL